MKILRSLSKNKRVHVANIDFKSQIISLKELILDQNISHFLTNDDVLMVNDWILNVEQLLSELPNGLVYIFGYSNPYNRGRHPNAIDNDVDVDLNTLNSLNLLSKKSIEKNLHQKTKKIIQFLNKTKKNLVIKPFLLSSKATNAINVSNNSVKEIYKPLWGYNKLKNIFNFTIDFNVNDFEVVTLDNDTLNATVFAVLFDSGYGSQGYNNSNGTLEDAKFFNTKELANKYGKQSLLKNSLIKSYAIIEVSLNIVSIIGQTNNIQENVEKIKILLNKETLNKVLVLGNKDKRIVL